VDYPVTLIVKDNENIDDNLKPIANPTSHSTQ